MRGALADRCKSRRQPSFTGLLPIALLAGACALAACDPDDEDTARACDGPHTGDRLEGLWELRATGTRRGCDDPRSEGELKIETSMPIEVVAAAEETSGTPTGREPDNEADAFVWRIERADFSLGEGPDGPDGVTVNGTVRGSCFRVVLSEELPGGDELLYELDGWIHQSAAARGDLRGSGPGTCEVRGTFTLVVQ